MILCNSIYIYIWVCECATRRYACMDLRVCASVCACACALACLYIYVYMYMYIVATKIDNIIVTLLVPCGSKRCSFHIICILSLSLSLPKYIYIYISCSHLLFCSQNCIFPLICFFCSSSFRRLACSPKFLHRCYHSHQSRFYRHLGLFLQPGEIPGIYCL